MQYYYLILNLICIGCPLVLSFDKNVAYYKKWKYVIFAILFNSMIFVPWDIYFTGLGVWGFTPQYLLGINLFDLPLEEVLFFVTVPFACIFIYECVHFYLMKFVTKLDAKLSWIYLLLFNALSIALMIYFSEKFYTVIVITVTLAASNLCVLFFRKYVAITIVSFLLICIPFLLVNSALTGYFTEAPVVWYNSADITEIRFGTIPIEDFYYNLLLVIGSFFFYFGTMRVLKVK